MKLKRMVNPQIAQVSDQLCHSSCFALLEGIEVLP